MSFEVIVSPTASAQIIEQTVWYELRRKELVFDLKQ